MDPAHPNRTVIVTGTTSGIGLATALTLAGRGHRVVATVRDEQRAAGLRLAADEAGLRVDVATLDITDDESVARCVDEVRERLGGIDVLVNNAGVGCSGSLEELPISDLQRVMDVNFAGTARMTKAVLPVMREAGGGRILAVGSMAGAFGQPFNDAYCASKFAVEGLYEALAPVAATFGIALSIIEAGPVVGRFVEQSVGIAEDGHAAPFDGLWSRFSELQARGYERAQTPQDVADVIATVIDTAQPLLRYQTSRGVARMVGLKIADMTGEQVVGATSAWLA